MILIVGATGYLGGIITRRLLAQGREVRLLVRPGSDYRPLVEAARRLPSATSDSRILWMWHAAASTR